MTAAIDELLAALWSPLLAVTTRSGPRASGMIAASAMQLSIVPERPRLAVALGKFNLTHDLVLASRVLAVHLLPATPEARARWSLDVVRALGFRTGHETPEKLAALRVRAGVTGAPILGDALGYLEARVAGVLDAGDETLVVADVVAGERLSEGPPLTLELFRRSMPSGWADEWAQSRDRQVRAAHRLLGR